MVGVVTAPDQTYCCETCAAQAVTRALENLRRAGFVLVMQSALIDGQDA